MTSLILVLTCAVLCSIASATMFKHKKHGFLRKNHDDDSDLDYGYESLRRYGDEDEDYDNRYRRPSDLVDNVEQLKALIHNFMVKFEENNKYEPTGQIQILKKAINNLVLVLVTQSYVNVFKPNLLRNNLASAVQEAGLGVGVLPRETTDDQRAAFISELAAEVKGLPLNIVNDFVLEYVSADDDSQLILNTMFKQRGEDEQENQRILGEVAFSKVIQEMILQSYMIDFNVQPVDGKVTITSSDGAKSRVFDAPPMDTLTKVQLLESREKYARKLLPEIEGQEDVYPK